MIERPQIAHSFVEQQNASLEANLERDFESLGERLSRRGIDVEWLVERARAYRVAVPSWGVGTGGTRFARFPGTGEPRGVEEKLHDCSVINQLTRITANISLHIPWDRHPDPARLKQLAVSLGLGFDAMNSNTFQDQADQAHSYKFGSLSHSDAAVRRQAVEHNLECIRIGQAIGSKALTVWIADGGSFPGQQHFRRTLERYMESMRAIYAALPADWQVFLEHKLYEPAFYSTVINDWGVSYWAATQLGPKARCLVDLGHHAPNVNIEMIVARLIQFGKLGGFHFNDSKYGDDDLDSGSITPFQLFLVFNELVDAELGRVAGFSPAYMLDQSHNVTDPIESLMSSAIEVQRAYVKALLVDRPALEGYQESNDVLMALATLKEAFNENVSPILAVARQRGGGAIDPIAAFRASRYRELKAQERGAANTASAGIV
jgi:L-rhamnose isomerase/sugar isomerase